MSGGLQFLGWYCIFNGVVGQVFGAVLVFLNGGKIDDEAHAMAHRSYAAFVAGALLIWVGRNGLA